VFILKKSPAVFAVLPVSPRPSAFIGSALRGEENEPILVQSFTEYTRTFGVLSRSHPMGFAVSQFFLNGGRDALIVRVTRGGVEATVTAGTLALMAASSGTGGTIYP